MFYDLASDNYIEFLIQGIASGISAHDIVPTALQFFDIFAKNVDAQHGFGMADQMPVHPEFGRFLAGCMCHTTKIKHTLVFNQRAQKICDRDPAIEVFDVHCFRLTCRPEFPFWPPGNSKYIASLTPAPRSITVDDRQGVHYYQVVYLSSSGGVVSQSQPDLIR